MPVTSARIQRAARWRAAGHSADRIDAKTSAPRSARSQASKGGARVPQRCTPQPGRSSEQMELDESTVFPPERGAGARSQLRAPRTKMSVLAKTRRITTQGSGCMIAPCARKIPASGVPAAGPLGVPWRLTRRAHSSPRQNSSAEEPAPSAAGIVV